MKNHWSNHNHNHNATNSHGKPYTEYANITLTNRISEGNLRFSIRRRISTYLLYS